MATLVKKKIAATLKLERFSGTQTNNDREIVMDFTENSIDENIWENLSLINGAVDVSLPLGGLVIVQMLVIKSDEEITIKLNGTSNLAIPTTEMVHRSKTGVTSVYLSNASGNVANIEYMMAEKVI